MIGMNAHYQTLATEIVSHSPTGFREATLSARLDESASEISLRCIDENGALLKPRVGGLSAAHIDEALAALQAEWPSGPCTICAFTLKADGNFTFTVEQDGQ
jgi:hypothetical protein